MGAWGKIRHLRQREIRKTSLYVIPPRGKGIPRPSEYRSFTEELIYSPIPLVLVFGREFRLEYLLSGCSGGIQVD